MCIDGPLLQHLLLRQRATPTLAAADRRARSLGLRRSAGSRVSPRTVVVADVTLNELNMKELELWVVVEPHANEAGQAAVLVRLEV